MNISELEIELDAAKDMFGDIEVRVISAKTGLPVPLFDIPYVDVDGQDEFILLTD